MANDHEEDKQDSVIMVRLPRKLHTDLMRLAAKRPRQVKGRRRVSMNRLCRDALQAVVDQAYREEVLTKDQTDGQ